MGHVPPQAGALRGGKLLDAPRRVVVAVVEKVAGHGKPRLVGHGTLAADAQPAVACEQAVEPGGEHGVGDLLVAPQAEREVAGLRAAEAAAGAVDARPRPPLEAEGVEIREVGVLLAAQAREGAPHQPSRRLDAHAPGLAKRHERRGGGEAGGVAAGLLGLRAEVVVAPAAVDGLEAFEQLDLLADELLELAAAGGVLRLALDHPHESLDAVGVGPAVVERARGGAAHGAQMADEPGLAAFERLRGRGPRVVRLDEGGHAQGRDGAAEGVVGAGHGGVDVQPLGVACRAPRAARVLAGDEEVHAAGDGGLDGLGRRRRDGHGLGRGLGRGGEAGGHEHQGCDGAAHGHWPFGFSASTVSPALMPWVISIFCPSLGPTTTMRFSWPAFVCT